MWKLHSRFLKPRQPKAKQAPSACQPEAAEPGTGGNVSRSEQASLATALLHRNDPDDLPVILQPSQSSDKRLNPFVQRPTPLNGSLPKPMVSPASEAAPAASSSGPPASVAAPAASASPASEAAPAASAVAAYTRLVHGEGQSQAQENGASGPAMHAQVQSMQDPAHASAAAYTKLLHSQHDERPSGTPHASTSPAADACTSDLDATNVRHSVDSSSLRSALAKQYAEDRPPKRPRLDAHHAQQSQPIGNGIMPDCLASAERQDSPRRPSIDGISAAATDFPSRHDDQAGMWQSERDPAGAHLDCLERYQQMACSVADVGQESGDHSSIPGTRTQIHSEVTQPGNLAPQPHQGAPSMNSTPSHRKVPQR